MLIREAAVALIAAVSGGGGHGIGDGEAPCYVTQHHQIRPTTWKIYLSICVRAA